jgi:hypothetical protein
MEKWIKSSKAKYPLFDLGPTHSVMKCGENWRAYFNGEWLGDFHTMTEAMVSCENSRNKITNAWVVR